MFTLNVNTKHILADLITPVSVYLRIRDVFPNTLLLESSDYHGNEDSYSFICIDPVAEFIVDNSEITETYPDGSVRTTKVSDQFTVPDKLNEFAGSFRVTEGMTKIVNGLFGYAAYDAVQYFEKIKLHADKKESHNIPDIRYGVFRYIIAFHPFTNELILQENVFQGEQAHGFEYLEKIITKQIIPVFSFSPEGAESSNITDEEYMQMVAQGKKHCFRGDVFQIVLSRQFRQAYTGDEFNVYRALRSINPSPYLFYFDYGSYKLFGSSPEAQIKILGQKAIINPIAGTFKRTGDDETDKKAALELCDDPKENAEHVMLVDLARNDLSRNAKEVTVETFKDVQYYSHVIHLVSTVTGKLSETVNKIQIMADTFPAGTLSGAPKYKAMELIDRYENQNRGFYGGGIGYIGFDGDINHAIMIRSFLSKNNILFYQAGAGIVSKSVEQNELQEVNNKLGALKKAVRKAVELK